jgi:hypothetical protein
MVPTIGTFSSTPAGTSMTGMRTSGSRTVRIVDPGSGPPALAASTVSPGAVAGPSARSDISDVAVRGDGSGPTSGADGSSRAVASGSASAGSIGMKIPATTAGSRPSPEDARPTSRAQCTRPPVALGPMGAMPRSTFLFGLRATVSTSPVLKTAPAANSAPAAAVAFRMLRRRARGRRQRPGMSARLERTVGRVRSTALPPQQGRHGYRSGRPVLGFRAEAGLRLGAADDQLGDRDRPRGAVAMSGRPGARLHRQASRCRG